MPRILFVAMPNSIHSVRWISQIADQGWELYLFPVYHARPHEDFRNITVFGAGPVRPAYLDRSVYFRRWSSYAYYLDFIESRLRGCKSNRFVERTLAWVIRNIKPDLIHSLEIQHAAYLTLNARKLLPPVFPKWIVTNWGSDIYLFGRLAAHKPKIQEVLTNCDYYSAECERDVRLARHLGFRGETLPVLPNGGGYNLQHVLALRQPGLTSERKVIALKGYQTWAGRALVGLQALRMCANRLQGYEVVIYSAEEDVKIAAELFAQDTDVKVTLLPPTSHEEILRLHGRARISIGLSISDAISTSLLEAIIMGSFPIQSCTACADEWIEDGYSGIIVPPEDPQAVAEAIQKALRDDRLVDTAAEINTRTAFERLDRTKIKQQAIQLYENILRSIQK